MKNTFFFSALLKLNHPSLFLQASAAYESPEETDAYLKFMVSIATILGIERTQAYSEMERILNMEKALANVGEIFFSVQCFRQEFENKFYLNFLRKESISI